MATCGCVGGGWVQMVATGEVGKARWRGGGVLLFFRMGHVFGLQGQEARCFLKAFLLSILTAENTQGHSILTEDKNLHVCLSFIFRLRLITISVGM
jgi:hypothetical protein